MRSLTKIFGETSHLNFEPKILVHLNKIILPVTKTTAYFITTVELVGYNPGSSVLKEGPLGIGSNNVEGCDVASVNSSRDKGGDIPCADIRIAPPYTAGLRPIFSHWSRHQRFGNGVISGSCTAPVERELVIIVAKGNQISDRVVGGGTLKMPDNERWIVGRIGMKGEEVEGYWSESVDREGIIIGEYCLVGHRSYL